MIPRTFFGIVIATAIGLPAVAGDMPALYPYNGINNCPSGLQPVVMGGVICCGTPNQSQSYASMMAHPVKKTYRKRIVRRAYRDTCQEGVKGCD